MRRWPATLAGIALATAIAGVDAPPSVRAQWAGRFAGRGAELIATWRSTGRPPLGVLVDPTDVRWIPDGAGGLYLVTDAALQRVQTFRPDGTPLRTFGDLGEGPGQLMAPVSADAEAPEPGRRLVVADSENYKLVLFDFESGAPIRDIDFPGERPPSTVAFRPDGVIEAYDDAFAYAFEFDRDGEPIRAYFRGGERTSFAWETGGSMIRAHGVSIERMRAGGTAWMALNAGDRAGPFEAAAAGPSGLIFTYATRRVSWQPRSSYVVERMLPGGVRAISATADDGLIAAMDKYGGRQAGLYRMNLEGSSRLDRWGDPLMVLGWIGRPTALTAAGEDVYLVDGLNRVQRFDSSGAAHGQFRRSGLERAAFATSGDAYVSRTLWGATTEDELDPEAPPPGFLRHLVERWSFGAPLTSGRHDLAGGIRPWTVRWDEPLPYDPARTTRLTAMELDEQAGEVVALDANRGRILRFSMSDGAMRETALPALAGRPGWSDIALSGSKALALHTGSRRVVEVNPDGTLVRHFDTPPLAVRIAATGDAVLIATGGGWLWELDSSSAVQGAWPIADADHPPSPPSDIAIGSGGLVFAGDHAAAAVRVYRPDAGVGSTLPDGQRPDAECILDAGTHLRPRLVIGQRATVSVRMRVACPMEPTGRKPDYGLRHTELTLVVPDGLSVVPGSASPPASVSDDGVVTWQLDWLPPDSTATVAVRAERGGSVQFDDVELQALDGWYGLHRTSVAGPAVDVEAFGPRLYLPAVEVR